MKIAPLAHFLLIKKINRKTTHSTRNLPSEVRIWPNREILTSLGGYRNGNGIGGSELGSDLENSSRPGPAGRLFIPTSAMAGNFFLHARLLTHALSSRMTILTQLVRFWEKKNTLSVNPHEARQIEKTFREVRNCWRGCRGRWMSRVY